VSSFVEMVNAMPSNLSPVPIVVPEVLLVDVDQVAALYAPVLRDHYRVTTAPSANVAMQYLGRASPALIVTELDLIDGRGEEICARAKALETPPTVLVTTAAAERVPEALAAGCDGVLLKPFAPNLLYARIGRLLRGRSVELRLRAQRHLLKSAHLSERSELLAARTNRHWPHTHCPYCPHTGVTSFEFASHRRAWYACLECRKVWLAKRQE
jgi:DNA-binding response OmpR family regulator